MFRKLFSLSKLQNNLNAIQNNSRNYVRKVNNRHRFVQNPGLQHQMESLGYDNNSDVGGGGGDSNSSEFHQLNDPDPEAFGDYESDFMNVHKTHTQHEREMRDKQEEIKHRIIGKKYFKQKQLNFLTWSEKQQIRHLNDSDSHEWTITRLSESFPATPEIIQKILRSKWLPNDTQRIIKHDENVKQNWESFRKGINLETMPLRLREHLQMFSQRNWTNDRPSLTAKHYQVEKRTFPLPKNLEFTNIITSCEKYNKQQIEENLKLKDFANGDNYTNRISSVSTAAAAASVNLSSLSSSNIMEDDRLRKMSTNNKNKEMYMLNTKSTENSNRKLITFRELQLNSNELIEKDDIIDDDNNNNNNARTTNTLNERMIVTSNNLSESQSNRTDNNYNIELSAVNKLKNPQGTGIIKQTKTMINGINKPIGNDDDADEMNKIILKKFDNIEIKLEKNDLNELTIPSIRDRIRIPKKLQKKGATYKLEDCYYDDDGSFLYRTPGMF